MYYRNVIPSHFFHESSNYFHYSNHFGTTMEISFFTVALNVEVSIISALFCANDIPLSPNSTHNLISYGAFSLCRYEYPPMYSTRNVMHGIRCISYYEYWLEMESQLAKTWNVATQISYVGIEITESEQSKVWDAGCNSHNVINSKTVTYLTQLRFKDTI